MLRLSESQQERKQWKNKHSVKSKPVMSSEDGPNARDSKGSEIQQSWLTLRSRYPRSDSNGPRDGKKKIKIIEIKWMKLRRLWTPGEL